MTKTISHPVAKKVDACPYCAGAQIVKTGMRENKYGAIQLFFCNQCKKKFTPLVTKHKTYPLRVILDAVSLYNELRTPEESAEAVGKRYGISVSAENVRRWPDDFREQLPFLRMREFVEKKFERKDIIERNRMFHGQIYDFLYHRAKMQLLLEEDFRHSQFKPLQHFLDLVSARGLQYKREPEKDYGKEMLDERGLVFTARGVMGREEAERRGLAALK